MLPDHYQTQISTLQNALADVKRQGDTETEIATLLQIARLAASGGDLGFANMHFDIAAKVMKRSGKGLHQLHQALGERALILRRGKNYEKSLDLYTQAAAAAEQHAGPMEQAGWIAKQGNIYRLMGKPDEARQSFSKAKEMFSALGKKGLAGVADQEGHFGLLASDGGDGRTAEKLYRRAVELAADARSAELINTWATNLGNALSRQRRYHEAWGFYKKAMAAALKMNDQSSIRDAAVRWSVSYRRAHRNKDAADVLITASNHMEDVAAQYELLHDAATDLQVAGEWNQLIDTAASMLALLKDRPENDEHVAACEWMKMARDRLKPPGPKPKSAAAAPTTLDFVIPSNMERFEESGNVEGMREMAHLICDVGLGVGSPNEESWQSFLSQTWVRYKVVSDAMKALCEAGHPEQSLELSQRFKSLGFCMPNIDRARKTGNKEAAPYVKSLTKLAGAVSALKGPAHPDGLQLTEAVRAAGEIVLEESEKLRDRDRILHAKLGGLIKPDELINALPAGDPVAIVDLFVGASCTIVHIIKREGNRVTVLYGINPAFTAKDALDLLQVWAESHVAGEISERQLEGLYKIADGLHDKLCCWLAKTLGGMGITQMILIPDGLTRHLPFQLSRVCADEIHIKIPGIPIDDAVFFGEVFPVEYAPCVQAVAVSQHQKRPRAISSVVSISDPKSNLPGARNTSNSLGSRVPPNVQYRSFLGAEATLSNLAGSVDDADVVFIGAHGIFKPANPADSYLEFHDGRWTMAEMMDRPAFLKSPIIILSACEVGASAPGDEMAASGIPGALISAGAACVLGGLWPLEDVSAGYVVEKFLDYLSHRGYRPAAALFRAVRDLRRLPKSKAIERCQMLLDRMDEDGTSDRLVEQYLRLNELKERIEDSKADCPFASPQFWGGIVIIGSGWSSPAGATVSASPTILIDLYLKRESAQAMIAKGQYDEARKSLDEILGLVDGAERARVLNAMASAVWQGRRKGTEQAARREAMQLLTEAEDLAKADQNEQLIRNIKTTVQKMNL